MSQRWPDMGKCRLPVARNECQGPHGGAVRQSARLGRWSTTANDWWMSLLGSRLGIGLAGINELEIPPIPHTSYLFLTGEARPRHCKPGLKQGLAVGPASEPISKVGEKA